MLLGLGWMDYIPGWWCRVHVCICAFTVGVSSLHALTEPAHYISKGVLHLMSALQFLRHLVLASS